MCVIRFPPRPAEAFCMGLFQLQVPDEIRDDLSRRVEESVYFCGMDGKPWQTQSSFKDGRLNVQIKTESSGKLYVLWPVKELGTRLLSTCTLATSSDKQFHLLLELARGSCYRARTLGDGWQRLGIPPNDAFNQHLQDGTACFLNALKKQDCPSEATEEAINAIAQLERALDLLAEDYAKRSIDNRKQKEPKLGTLLAGSLFPLDSDETASQSIPSQELFLQTFNAAAVQFRWAELEKRKGEFDFDRLVHIVSDCQKAGIKTIGGPLIDFKKELLPDWILEDENDFDSLQHFALNYVERTVSRLRGTVQLWNCMSGINNDGPIPMDDEQIMRLSLAILQKVRGTDPETPAIISFDQPFGEYLRRPNRGIPAMKVAETLIRSGLGIAGVGLDIKLNYDQYGTMPRSAIDFSQNLDSWGSLGVPLLVQLSTPGAIDSDAHAIQNLSIVEDSATSETAGDSQLRDIRPLLQILLAKPYVHGIVWNGWADHAPHLLPNSGLVDQQHQPRPLQRHLAELRELHLM